MRRLIAVSIMFIVLGCFTAACLEGLLKPKTVLCPGLLYCGSASVPQRVTGGTCCTVVDLDAGGRALPNAAIGYLCAFGSGREPAGCMATLEQARFICPNAPSIVRCEAE